MKTQTYRWFDPMIQLKCNVETCNCEKLYIIIYFSTIRLSIYFTSLCHSLLIIFLFFFFVKSFISNKCNVFFLVFDNLENSNNLFFLVFDNLENSRYLLYQINAIFSFEFLTIWTIFDNLICQIMEYFLVVSGFCAQSFSQCEHNVLAHLQRIKSL